MLRIYYASYGDAWYLFIGTWEEWTKFQETNIVFAEIIDKEVK